MTTPDTPPTPTLRQQVLLERIAAQREHLLRRHTKPAKPEGIDPADPLAIRLCSFARLHPLLSAAALGVTVLAGPARLGRLASALLPLLLQARR